MKSIHLLYHVSFVEILFLAFVLIFVVEHYYLNCHSHYYYYYYYYYYYDCKSHFFLFQNPFSSYLVLISFLLYIDSLILLHWFSHLIYHDAYHVAVVHYPPHFSYIFGVVVVMYVDYDYIVLSIVLYTSSYVHLIVPQHHCSYALHFPYYLIDY